MKKWEHRYITEKGNTMAGKLEGLKIALLVADGFEQVEMTQPRKALDEAGAHTVLISPNVHKVQGSHHMDRGDIFNVDVALEKAKPDDYDGLHLPGGVFNPDTLRVNLQAVEFVRSFVIAQKPISVLCHGPWTLIEAQGVKGKTMTSWISLKTDLINAGAYWVDKEVVRDGLLVSSRKPADIPVFNPVMIGLFAELKQ